MSISKIDKVDIITQSQKTGDYVLIIVADEPWEDSNTFRYQLQEKLNNYCTYVIEGQIKQQYPDFKQRQLTIRISSTTPIPGHALEFISKLRQVFQPYGLDIETEELT